MQPGSLAPTAKVTAGAAAGLMMTVVLWVLSTYAHVDLPAEVAAALTTLAAFGIAWITTEVIHQPLPLAVAPLLAGAAPEDAVERVPRHTCGQCGSVFVPQAYTLAAPLTVVSAS